MYHLYEHFSYAENTHSIQLKLQLSSE